MSVRIEDAERIAKFYGVDGAIVFLVEGGEISYASYGKNRRQCERMRELADGMFEGVAERYPVREGE